MNKILIVSFLYYPSTAVGARRIYNFKKYLSNENIDVTVLTVTKNKYAEIDRTLEIDNYNNNIVKTTCIGPIKVGKRKVYEGFVLGIKRRMLYVLNLLLKKVLFPDEYVGWLPFAIMKGVALHRKKRFDMIIASGMPWTNFLVAEILSFICKIPFILDYRDPWTCCQKRIFPSLLIKKISINYEKRLVKRVYKIIVNTSSEKQVFIHEFGERHEAKVFVIGNGYDPEVYSRLKEYKREKTIKQGKIFKLIHTGTFYESRTIYSLLKAILELKNEKIICKKNFKLISYGPFVSKDREFVKKYKLDDVIQENDFISYYDSLKELCNSSMNLLVVGSNDAPRIPAKLFDYLIVEKPIFCIGPVISEVRNIIEKNNYGVNCDINNYLDVKTNLMILLQKHLSGELNNRLIVRSDYSIVNQIKKLAKIIKEQN